MSDKQEVRRRRRGQWSQRALIIALGVSLGLGAKWVVKTWQSVSAADPANVAAPGPSAQPSPRSTKERE